MSESNFIKANANKDYIAYQFTEVLRNLIRAIAAEDSSGGLIEASEKMSFVNKLLAECEENISWHSLFAEAVENLDPDVSWDSADRDIIDAARAGMSMLMEMTCEDNAARARASKREHNFLERIRMMEEAKEERRKEFASKQRKDPKSEPDFSCFDTDE